MTTSNLYYECHITIEPVFGEHLEDLRGLVGLYGFRVADLLMKRNRQATPERSEFDTFCTTRGRVYEDIHRRMTDCVQALMSADFEVWRYKIEDTLLDVRTRPEHVDSDDDLIDALAASD